MGIWYDTEFMYGRRKTNPMDDPNVMPPRRAPPPKDSVMKVPGLNTDRGRLENILEPKANFLRATPDGISQPALSGMRNNNQFEQGLLSGEIPWYGGGLQSARADYNPDYISLFEPWDTSNKRAAWSLLHDAEMIRQIQEGTRTPESIVPHPEWGFTLLDQLPYIPRQLRGLIPPVLYPHVKNEFGFPLMDSPRPLFHPYTAPPLFNEAMALRERGRQPTKVELPFVSPETLQRYNQSR